METVNDLNQRKRFKMGTKLKVFVIIFVGIFLVVSIISGAAYYKYNKEVKSNSIERIKEISNESVKEITETEYEVTNQNTSSGSSIKNPLTDVNPRTSFLPNVLQ